MFFAIGILSVNFGYGGNTIHVNSPYAVTTVVSLLSLLSVFVVTLFCASGVLRDSEYKMQEMVFTTGLSRWQYICSRFTGVISCTLVVFVFALLAMLLGLVLFGKAHQLGAFSLYNYLWPLVVMALPNILLNTVLLFSVSAFTRNVAATYISGVLLYVLYFAGSMLGNSPLMASYSPASPDEAYMVSLLDPYGLAAFYSETSFWTATERNSQFPALQGAFLINRMLWFAVSVMIMMVTYARASFTLSSKRAKGHANEVSEAFVPVFYTVVSTVTDRLMAYWLMFRARVKMELLTIFRSIPFMVMALLWVFLVAIETSEHIFHGMFSISSYPTTGLIVNIIWSASFVLIPVIFYSNELMWRERSMKISELVDVTPVSNVVLFLSKCVVLALVIVMFILFSILTGIGIQVFSGYFKFELPLYLSIYYYGGLRLFLFGILALFTQSLIPNKYTGMAVSGGMIGLLLMLPRFGVEHHLLRYADVPGLQYSDMNGFGHFSTAFHWQIIYWTAVTGIFAVLAFSFWRRGTFQTKLKCPGALVKPFLAAFLVTAIISGGAIFYKTNIQKPYKTSKEIIGRRVDYEKKYKSFGNLPQPIISSVKTEVDLFPDERMYHVKGTYAVKNSGQQPISKVWVGFDPEVQPKAVVLDDMFPDEQDERFKQYWFELDNALMPGDSLVMEFSLQVEKTGFMPFNTENSILDNGTYIELEKYLPFFGYAPDLELKDPVERERYGLPEQEGWVKLENAKPEKYEWVNYEAVISTLTDQKVVSVGMLQDEWEIEGRRYFHFKTEQAIPFMFGISSARYKMIKEVHNGIEVEFYYHPGHEYNIERMLESTKHSLDYYGKHFSPYQFEHIRLAEIPHYRGAATAYPGVIFVAESMFLYDFRDPEKPDYAYTMAHEVAHQWWGGQLMPADVQGFKTLTETLAQHSELLLLEEKYGRGKMTQFIAHELDAYMSSRGYDPGNELPLYRSESQVFVHYQKGAVIMNGLNRLMGEQKLNTALANLLKKHGYPANKPTTEDLLLEIYTVAPENRELIDDWFKRVFIYDLKVLSAKYEQQEDGKFKVIAEIMTKRNSVRENKQEVAATLSEAIEVGVFTAYPDEAADDQVLYLEPHHFSSGTTTLIFMVDEKPEILAIDPYLTRVDRNRIDNIMVFGK
ncbi:hypothetical protein C900_03410 [Fulvivirga imtechensis AK7]|uniref:Peptidase M1 membrane alanine aminopeptidase domain-containing protein n=1 Tax=Fulvivirga imtechensis AK7 TaxID=1237149 RepID=L8JU31_9BACT|nr:M1 family aminopeptidase [Fulvivirga imtechensis]ELR70802.1 hypothetical protein C900_03410 [Fulvivirga imtechensis AK7]